MTKLKIAFITNEANSAMDDEIAHEYAAPETIEEITRALEDANAHVMMFTADGRLYDRLSSERGIDFGFNLGEGTSDIPNRKSYVASVLDQLEIPYSGSSPSAHTTAADKAETHRRLSGRVNQPIWQRFEDEKDPLREDLLYPLFVKPATEGSSMGITQNNVVYDDKQLRRALRDVIGRGYPAIVEQFLDGIEYNVGIIGDLILPVIECDLKDIPGRPLVKDPHVKNVDQHHCYPVTSDSLRDALIMEAIRAHEGVGAYDSSRCDFRSPENESNKPRFLEINLMVGLHPEKSKIPNQALLGGIEYHDLIQTIVYSSMTRWATDARYASTFTPDSISGFHAGYTRASRGASNIYRGRDSSYSLIGSVDNGSSRARIA